jgi:hypothetical protein
MQYLSNTLRRLRRLATVILLAWATTASVCVEAREGATAIPQAIQPVALSAGQAHAVSLLLDVRPEHPVPLFLFTDPNKDPDDLSVLVLASYLQEEGFLDLRCVLTTLGDKETRIKRARFARTVLDDLGLEGARVGAGVDYGFEVRDAGGAVDEKATEGRRHDHQVFMKTPLADPRALVATDGLALLKAELEKVPDGSAVLLINAGMADPAALLREAPELAKKKTAKVVIMGGVEPQVDDQGFAVADKRAYNNTTHQPSADFTYRRVQELGIPLVVVTKEAAYATAAPRSFYDGMAATRHPIGVYLRDQQKQSVENLWGGIQEGHLPAALTAEWFFETFTDVDTDTPAGQAELQRAERSGDDFEDIWDQVSKLNLYDPLALLAAVPGAGERFFRGHRLEGSRGDVLLIGKDSVAEPVLVKELLSALAVRGLSP